LFASDKIQIGLTFLLPAYPGCPGQEAVEWVSLSVYLMFLLLYSRGESVVS